MNKSLCEKLEKYSAGNPLRMHMPGHKGSRNSCVKDAEYDITEIPGFDNLHGAEGILLESMELASKLWGSCRSYYLINGSTCGILAGVRALTRRGDKVLIARNCHKSVYHAIELCGITPIFLMPAVIEDWQIFGSVSPESVEQALKENPDIKLVVITSPTYEGVISDIEKIARTVHSYGAKLLVDEAHGAHLGLDSYFEQSSVRYGADIVVQSLHKTLDCPTQTAILHASQNTDMQRLEHQLSVFESSSPSYLFMSSTDKFIRKLWACKNSLSEWTEALGLFYSRTARLSNIEILAHTCNNIPEIFAYDKSKIIFRCNDTAAFAHKLRNKYNVEFESVSSDFVIAMTGVGDNMETLGKFAEILLAADACEGRYCTEKRDFAYSKPKLSMLPEQALEKQGRAIPVSEAVGKICAEYVWKYPPGIPILIPGEIIPETFRKVWEAGFLSEIHSQSGLLPDMITVTDN